MFLQHNPAVLQQLSRRHLFPLDKFRGVEPQSEQLQLAGEEVEAELSQLTLPGPVLAPGHCSLLTANGLACDPGLAYRYRVSPVLPILCTVLSAAR